MLTRIHRKTSRSVKMCDWSNQRLSEGLTTPSFTFQPFLALFTYICTSSENNSKKMVKFDDVSKKADDLFKKVNFHFFSLIFTDFFEKMNFSEIFLLR